MPTRSIARSRWQSFRSHVRSRRTISNELNETARNVPIASTSEGAPHLAGTGATRRILFESRPQFQAVEDAMNGSVMESHDGIGSLWVRE